MLKSNWRIGVIFISLILTMTTLVQAQFIVEQKEYRLPVNYDLLPEDTEFEDPMDEAKYFLNLSDDELRSGAMEMEESKSTMYLDGENFAAEFESEDQGKVTYIFDAKDKTFYYVIWAQKKVFHMTDEDMKQTQKDADVMKDKMMEGMSPEMRKQVEEQMKLEAQAKKMKVTATGKKMKKYGFDCSQYVAESEDELKIIWATDDLPGIRKSFEKFAEQMASIFPSDEEDSQDEWDLVGGKIPVVVRSMRSGITAMGMPEIEITELTKITQTKPPAEKFIPPSAADGYTHGSMKDMMSQMMQMFQEE